MKSIFVLVVVTLSFSLISFAQVSPAKKVNEFFKDKTKIENPYELRDPFRPPHFKGQKTEEVRKENFFKTADGTFTNLEQMKDLNVQDIKIVGVLIGKERRVLARVKDQKNIVILKEGMKFGQDNAELKAILPGGVVLVEKIINVYGQEEYLETVIPISK